MINKGKTKHGMRNTSEYRSWCSMKARCFSKIRHDYHRYGGRGITVCKRWFKFENFIKDMGLKPSPMHSLDRIDVNKGYYKKNCRWATKRKQAGNRTDSVNYKGENSAEASERLGGNSVLVRRRIKIGWSIKKAFTTPVRPYRAIINKHIEK